MLPEAQSGLPAVSHPCTVALTLGDSNGLGPELVCRLFNNSTSTSHRILIIGPEQALQHHLRTKSRLPFWHPLPDAQSISLQPPGIYLHSPPCLASLPVQPGLAATAGGKAAGESLEVACALLASHAVQALVTCPLNKAMLQQAGFDFAGHTEFLATRAGLTPDKVCMHFWGPELRVSLATTHPALRAVPEMITTELILHKLELTHKLIHSMDMRRPIAVCGLNPHAGEEGSIGDEEQHIIAPAVAEATARGWNVVGPLAADTVFHRARLGDFSAVLAMYHDQGLAPFKLLHFHAGIQMTLGLPYVRTSPDHGTGYDLVGRDAASPESLRNALTMALNLISTRQ
ncbi:4-hydroxythreonine-4-phosphate dehydrogenase PdxA [Desulfonatronum parangueonense]